MSGPTVHVGAEKFTAAMTGEVYHSDGAIFNSADPALMERLYAEDGFLTKTQESYDRMVGYAREFTDVNTGNITRVYHLRSPDDLALVTGTMLDYCMAEPSLKQAWNDIEYDHPNYDNNDTRVGADDPMWQHVHSGEVKRSNDGFISREWYWNTPNPLSYEDQFVMINNHRKISSNIEVILDDDTTASGDDYVLAKIDGKIYKMF